MDFIIVLLKLLAVIIGVLAIGVFVFIGHIQRLASRVQLEVPPMKWHSYPELEATYGFFLPLVFTLFRDNGLLIVRASPELVERDDFKFSPGQSFEEVLTELDEHLKKDCWYLHLDLCDVMLLARPRRRIMNLSEILSSLTPAPVRHTA